MWEEVGFVLKLREDERSDGSAKHNWDRNRQRGPLSKIIKNRRSYRYRGNLVKKIFLFSGSHQTMPLGTLNKSGHLVYHLLWLFLWKPQWLNQPYSPYEANRYSVISNRKGTNKTLWNFSFFFSDFKSSHKKKKLEKQIYT